MSGSHLGGFAACLALFTGCLEADLSPLDIEAQEMRVVEGSADSIGLLEFLNAVETTVEVLDFDAKLDKRAAGNLIGHRNGGDDLFGTTDDDLFNSVAEVDAVRWVGPRTLQRLVDYAYTLGFVPTGNDYLGTWDNVAFSVNEAENTVEWVNQADAWTLDEQLQLDSRAVNSILDAGRINSVEQLAELYYVGESALVAIKNAAVFGGDFPEYAE